MDLGRDLGCFRAFGEYGDVLVGCISSSRLWDDCLCNCFIFCIFVSDWDWDWDWRSKYSIRYWLNETMADSYERSDEDYSCKWDLKFGRVRIVGEKLTEQWSYFISCRRRFQHLFFHKKQLWMKVSNHTVCGGGNWKIKILYLFLFGMLTIWTLPLVRANLTFYIPF